MIKKCLNCDKEFEQPEGKREKKFCSDNCRAAFNQKNKSEFVRVPREMWEKMNDDTKKEESVLPPETKKDATISNVLETRTPFMSDAIKKKLGIK